MRVRSLLFIFFVLAGFVVSAQATEKAKVYRPDIPGNFLIDFGVHGTTLAPSNFDIGWFGSRTINVYYYYPLRFGKSRFSFNPGIGLSMDRFKFRTAYFVADTLRDGSFEMVRNFRPDSTVYRGLKKSILGQHYLDIPLEFKFSLRPEDPNRTFWVALGGRAGYLYNPFTKIKYRENGETKVQLNKMFHGQDKFRYGPSLRVGFGNFNLFGFYNLSPLFAKDKGPDNTTMTSFSMGISIIGL